VISSETPYKLDEIIRDTWTGLYRRPKEILKDFKMKKTMIKKIIHFLERDKDITLYDEFHYIYITLRELIEVIKTQNK